MDNMDTLITNPVPSMNGFMWVDQTRSEASSTEEPEPIDNFGNILGGTQEVVLTWNTSSPIWTPLRVQGDSLR